VSACLWWSDAADKIIFDYRHLVCLSALSRPYDFAFLQPCLPVMSVLERPTLFCVWFVLSLPRPLRGRLLARLGDVIGSSLPMHDPLLVIRMILLFL
jgi:hypothetical protein